MDEALLQAVADRQEITNLINHFCALVDAGGDDLSRIGSEVFTEDGVDDHSNGAIRKGVQNGRHEINEFYARRRNQRPGVRAHCATNILIELDGDAASARWYAMAWHWFDVETGERPQKQADVVAIEPIEQEFRRTSDGWRVSRQAINFLGIGVGPVGLATPQAPVATRS